MPRATWNGETIAESDKTVMVEGNHYFPPESLRRDLTVPSDTTTICSWKGTASYLTLQAGGESSPDAVWFYPDPKPKAAEIKDHVAFTGAVRVED